MKLSATRLPAPWDKRVYDFLVSQDMRPEDRTDYTVVLADGEEVLATGSRSENVLKHIAVASDYRGAGLAATILTELVHDAERAGYHHLFLYTISDNTALFRQLGFHLIAQTGEAALMENRRDGVAQFVAALAEPETPKNAGCIVANCNPFTLGHLALAQYAAARCERLYFFVLSAEKSAFPAATRLEMAKLALGGLENVQVCPTGQYLISAATFPAYFVKETACAANVYYDLDIAVFGHCFAGPLGIKTRFAGTEPVDEVTRGYNRRMAALLPGFGVRFEEMPRLNMDGETVSASAVRRLLQAGDHATALRLVPYTVRNYIEDYVENKK